MNRSEVVAEVAKRSGLAESQVDLVVKTFTETVIEALGRGETVTIRRFGRFEARVRRAMTRPHPKTQEPVEIPERVGVKFLASELLTEELNK